MGSVPLDTSVQQMPANDLYLGQTARLGQLPTYSVNSTTTVTGSVTIQDSGVVQWEVPIHITPAVCSNDLFIEGATLGFFLCTRCMSFDYRITLSRKRAPACYPKCLYCTFAWSK